jgi:hypothetical protein
VESQQNLFVYWSRPRCNDDTLRMVVGFVRSTHGASMAGLVSIGCVFGGLSDSHFSCL